MGKIKIIGTVVGAIGTIFGIGYLANRFTYDEEGYNGFGYDEDGFGRDGYNKNGFDRNNLDREGFDVKGFDVEGYNRKGFDRLGYNREGYDIDGFNNKGFNKNGFNKRGYDCEGYNKDGFDISKNNKTYYEQKVEDMDNLIKKANTQIENQSFDYALQDLRKALEVGIKCVLMHKIGSVNPNNKLDTYIKECKKYNLCERQFIEELFDAKEHCNCEMHDSEIDKGFKETNFVRAITIKLMKFVSKVTFITEN